MFFQPGDNSHIYRLFKSPHLQAGVNNGRRLTFRNSEKSIIGFAPYFVFEAEARSIWNQNLLEPSCVIDTGAIFGAIDVYCHDKAVKTFDYAALQCIFNVEKSLLHSALY